MRLSQFIEQNVETIVTEWEAFARETIAPAQTMTPLALRDHASQILLAIATDLKHPQSEVERRDKSRGLERSDVSETSAATHGVLRQLVGFDVVQLAAEYRAVRATVLRLWNASIDPSTRATDAEGLARFNEAVDQALAESLAAYSERVANSRDTFLAVLGHDLRSPLSAIASALRLLGDSRVDDARRHQMLQIANRSVTSMQHMITDLLEYTRTRLGRGIEIVAVPGDLSKLCGDVFEEVASAHPEHAFIAQIAPGIVTAFDAARMRQVLTNLLSNAVKYGDPHSAITLTVAHEGDEITLAVGNRGNPISADALQVIFDPLVRIPASETDEGGERDSSLGLGLYIVREIVNAHNAAISVTSSDLDGTVFVVHFPAKACSTG